MFLLAAIVRSSTQHTHLGERDVVLRHFALPVLHQLFAELLVERAGVRQEPGGEQDVADEPVDLRLEALAGGRPANLLARQPVDQRRRHVHLAPTSVRVVHQCLHRQPAAAVVMLPSTPVQPNYLLCWPSE